MRDQYERDDGIRNHFNALFNDYQKHITTRFEELQAGNPDNLNIQTMAEDAKTFIGHIEMAWTASQYREQDTRRSKQQGDAEVLLIDILTYLNHAITDPKTAADSDRLQDLIQRIPKHHSREWDRIGTYLGCALVLTIGVVGIVVLGTLFPPGLVLLPTLYYILSSTFLLTGVATLGPRILTLLDLAERQEIVLEPVKSELLKSTPVFTSEQPQKSPSLFTSDHTHFSPKYQKVARNVAHSIQPQVNYLEKWFHEHFESETRSSSPKNKL
ncbi:MAG: hypothetical protein CK424_02635 [Legionella sp.]|nr:MAG: hypothetical protein CK424_02635 [Legionella sp.]